MTQEEFFDIFNKTSASWRKEDGYIIADSDDPITAVARKKLGDLFVQSHYFDMNTLIKGLGLDPTLGGEIALAMFGHHHLHPSLALLRKKLLVACRLLPE